MTTQVPALQTSAVTGLFDVRTRDGGFAGYTRHDPREMRGCPLQLRVAREHQPVFRPEELSIATMADYKTITVHVDMIPILGGLFAVWGCSPSDVTALMANEWITMTGPDRLRNAGPVTAERDHVTQCIRLSNGVVSREIPLTEYHMMSSNQRHDIGMILERSFQSRRGTDRRPASPVYGPSPLEQILRNFPPTAVVARPEPKPPVEEYVVINKPRRLSYD